MGVIVATTRVAANVVTGTQDITTSDLGGLTPKAVQLYAMRVTVDDTPVDGLGWYMGASDGTNEWCEGYEEQHGQGNMDVSYLQNTDTNRILTIFDGTADDVVEATADFVSFITDGVRITWTDAPPAAYLIIAVFYAGTDLSANVGTQALGNTADALIEITSVGFEADVIFPVLLKSSSTLPAGISLGLVHNDRGGTVTQRVLSHKQRNGFATSAVGVRMTEDRCLVKLQATDAIDWVGIAQTFDTSGFDIQLAGGRAPGNSAIGWLALRFGDTPVVDSKVYTYSTPTGTGNHTDSGPGFTPQFVMYLPNLTVTPGISEYDADGGSYGVLVADTNNLYTDSTASEDGPTTSNNQSLSSDALTFVNDEGAVIQEATLVSMGATGPVWNWTTVDATTRTWPALAIEVSPVSSDVTITGTGFTNTNAFGVGTIVSEYVITGTGFTDADAFGVGTIVSEYIIQSIGFTNTNAFGNGSITTEYEIIGAGFENSNSFGLGTITADAIDQTITGSGFTNTNAFGLGTVVSAYEINGSGFTNTNTFGNGEISSTYIIAGIGFENVNAFGVGTVSASYDIAGIGFTNTQTFGLGTVSAEYIISGSGFTNTQSFGNGIVAIEGGPQTIIGIGFTNTNSFGVGTLVVENVITGTGFVNTNAFGNGVIDRGVVGQGFTNTNAFGLGIITAGDYVITGIGFVNVNSFGLGTLVGGVVAPDIIIYLSSNLSRLVQLESGLTRTSSLSSDLDRTMVLISGLTRTVGLSSDLDQTIVLISDIG